MTLATAYKQLSKAAAIFAFALLCAQTAAIVHDHEPSEAELCVVCSTSTEQADVPALAAADTVLPRAERAESAASWIPERTPLRLNPARGPPTA